MPQTARPRRRAAPLAPEDRRAAILDAVVPLLRERGGDVSTQQMAEAAGVAEGTLFRAFGSKEEIVRAAVAHYLDPVPFRSRLRGIDAELPVESKVREVLTLLTERFSGVVGFLSALGMQGRPPVAEERGDESWLGIVEELFRRDAARLRVPVATLAFTLRLVAFGSAIPVFNAPHRFTVDELLDIVANGAILREA